MYLATLLAGALLFSSQLVLVAGAETRVCETVGFESQQKKDGGFALRSAVSSKQDDATVGSVVQLKGGRLLELDGVTISAKQCFEIDHQLPIALITKWFEENPEICDEIAKDPKQGDKIKEIKAIINGSGNLQQLPSFLNNAKGQLETFWESKKPVKVDGAFDKTDYRKVFGIVKYQKTAIDKQALLLDAKLKALLPKPPAAKDTVVALVKDFFDYVQDQEKIVGTAIKVEGPVNLGQGSAAAWKAAKTKPEPFKKLVTEAIEAASKYEALDSANKPIEGPNCGPPGSGDDVDDLTASFGQTTLNEKAGESSKVKKVTKKKSTEQVRPKTPPRPPTPTRRELSSSESHPIWRRKASSMIRRDLARL